MGAWPATWPRSAHFIGVGGVAMSALACLLARRGVSVSGSDGAIYPPASEMLTTAGIHLSTPFAAAHLDAQPELVVVGNAISRGNPELERALDDALRLCSLPELIERLIVPGRRVTAVAGTHGKTTTACMAAWLHEACGRSPSFVIGARPGNFSTGAVLGEGEDLIIEADEYDSAFFDKGAKFLHYWPRIAILGNVEFDHADIYADLDALRRSFALLLRLIPAEGTLIVGADSPVAEELAQEARCRVLRFSSRPEHDLGILERVEGEKGQEVSFARAGQPLGRFRLALGGEHNALNALAALLAFEAAGGSLARAAQALATFRGPRRRLELLHRDAETAAYDDFAHHPSAVACTLATLRALVPAGGRVVACLEPRSNTMVRALVQDALLESLSLADVVWLGEVDRPERFTAAQRLDVAALVSGLREKGREAFGPCVAGEILEGVLSDLRPGDRIVLMSNGAFGGLPARLRKALAQRNAP